ncbi:hypothetical protein IQ258_17720 [Coleofasciculus sp. LEGE 07081]|nr:hypothetical protein [Coleofasciculus sp. LEGE 07081]MBE9127946.1 hypothetical protein [Coleofasciculus sp. LEGE 07081]
MNPDAQVLTNMPVPTIEPKPIMTAPKTPSSRVSISDEVLSAMQHLPVI